jgi:hypothetical protein
MHVENRKQIRRPLEIPAKLSADGGAPPRDCVVIDISDYGARLRIDTPQDTPNDFTIVLAPRGPFRRCHVVWRAAGHVGVIFHRDYQEAADSEFTDYRWPIAVFGSDYGVAKS